MAGQPTAARVEQLFAFYQGLSQALKDHAQATFKLDQPQADGASLREHLQAAQANPLAKGGPRHESLDVPPLPPLCRGVWRIFTELHQRRGGGFGPAPIDETRLLAWCQLYGRQLSEWEINSIFAIDACWLNAQAEAQKTQANTDKKPPTPPTHKP